MKDARKVTFRISGELYKHLKEKADRSSNPVATVVRSAIYAYLYGPEVKE